MKQMILILNKYISFDPQLITCSTKIIKVIFYILFFHTKSSQSGVYFPNLQPISIWSSRISNGPWPHIADGYHTGPTSLGEDNSKSYPMNGEYRTKEENQKGNKERE